MTREGGTVGTIEAVDAQYATLAATKSKVKLPLNAFGTGDKGLLLGMTADQVDAAAGNAGQQAQRARLGRPGEARKGHGRVRHQGPARRHDRGRAIDFAVIATQKNKVRLPLTAFAGAGNGPIIGLSAAELDAAAEQAKPKTN